MLTTKDFCRDTIDLVKSIETRFLELGARLYKIQEERLWEGSYDTFKDFLAEARITPGNASILSSIHRSYIVEGGIKQEELAGVPYSNLYEAIPLIEKEGVTSAAVKAETLTRAEIKDEIYDHKFGSHTHTIKDNRRFAVCECGRFFEVYENN